MYICLISIDLLVSIVEIFRNFILHLLWEFFLSLILSWWVKEHPRKGHLKFVAIFFVSLFGLIVSVMLFLNFFPNNSLSCFCNSIAFNFNMILTWYCEFMILWYLVLWLLLSILFYYYLLNRKKQFIYRNLNGSTCSFFVSSRIFHNFVSRP